MKRIDIVETKIPFKSVPPARQATRFFVVHHIGTMPKSIASDLVDVLMINSWHLDRGWLGFAYHYLIKTDGVVERGRPWQSMGSHCKGFNHESIGICVVGDFSAAAPNADQLDALERLMADLCDVYGLPATADTIRGHRDLVDTECPGNGLYDLLPAIRTKVASLL
jgi:N-acetylmuramoyl-L-alanine amidase